MSAFKVYLPSNACEDAFPRNKPTDYSTRFDDPISLEGKWEVGVESIAYSSHINDEKERAKIDITMEVMKPVPVNDLCRYQFKTSENGNWKGFKGVLPNDFESDSKNIRLVIATLNYMNYDILKPEVFPTIFTFSSNHSNQIVYKCNDANFALRLTPKLTKVLGFGYETIFCGNITVVGEETVSLDEPLVKEDYLMRYVNVLVQEKQRRCIIKAQGEHFDGTQETALNLWKKGVSNYVDIRAEFKSGKLILHNHCEDIALVFSHDFKKDFNFYNQTIIGRGTEWAAGQAHLQLDHTNSNWCVDVYSTQMDETGVKNTLYSTISLYPWRSKTIKKLIHSINSQVQTRIQQTLKEYYDVHTHGFHLSLEETDHCKLMLGHRVKVFFSKNLSYLLSFPDVILQGIEIYGVREVESLEKHARQLHLLSNLIQPTAYGKNQRHIMCDFLHKQSSKQIIEKRFHPISYHPVARNTIDQIHVQLTDEVYQPIAINDVKTMLTLYFRQVK